MSEWDENEPEPSSESVQSGFQVDPKLIAAAEELEGKLASALEKVGGVGVFAVNRSAAGLHYSSSLIEPADPDEDTRLAVSRRRLAAGLDGAARWLHSFESDDLPAGPDRGVAGFVRRKPLTSLVVGAGVGALIGFLLRRLP